jgi:hypothetical protein
MAAEEPRASGLNLPHIHIDCRAPPHAAVDPTARWPPVDEFGCDENDPALVARLAQNPPAADLTCTSSVEDNDLAEYEKLLREIAGSRSGAEVAKYTAVPRISTAASLPTSNAPAAKSK